MSGTRQDSGGAQLTGNVSGLPSIPVRSVESGFRIGIRSAFVPRLVQRYHSGVIASAKGHAHGAELHSFLKDGAIAERHAPFVVLTTSVTASEGDQATRTRTGKVVVTNARRDMCASMSKGVGLCLSIVLSWNGYSGAPCSKVRRFTTEMASGATTATATWSSGSSDSLAVRGRRTCSSSLVGSSRPMSRWRRLVSSSH